MIDKYPTELVDNRNIIESSFIFCLYKNPDLFGDFDIKADKDFMLDDSKFYYSLGLEMYKLGYKSFDDASIHTYIEGKETIKNGYIRRGGYKTIDEIKRILSEENIDTYYDELIKSNMLVQLHDKGFNVLTDLDKFKKMNSNQVYDYLDYQLNNVFLNKSSGVQIEELTIDDDFIAECNSGDEMGISYGEAAPILNYSTLGVPLGNLYLIGGYSGVGKSSWMFSNIILPAINQGNKCCIISNEQKSKEFKILLLSMVLAKEFKYFGLTRKKLKMGGFNEEQMEYIKKAQKFIEVKYKDTLRFVKLFSYDILSVKKIIKKLAKQGYNLFAYDTMKSSDMSEGQVWQGLVEDSKALFQLASKENVAIIPTYQLALHTINQRFLNASCLSNAKQIKEVFSEMVYFRKLWEDEYDGEKYDVKPYNWKKDSDGKYTKIKEYVTLDPNKKYLISFLDKTRNGEDGITIVYEFNGRYNMWYEIGFCTVHNDRGQKY